MMNFQQFMCSSETSFKSKHNTSFDYENNNNNRTEIFSSTICLYFPSYFSNYAVLVLIATSLIVQLSHICKIILMITIAGMYFIYSHLLFVHCYIQSVPEVVSDTYVGVSYIFFSL